MSSDDNLSNGDDNHSISLTLGQWKVARVCGLVWGLILDMTLHLQDCIMAEIQEVMLLILTHYGHSYLMHKISNNVLIIFKLCYFEYRLVHCSFRICNYYWCTTCIHCTTISLIVIPSENLEVVLLFTVCYDGCVTYQIINQLSSAYAIVCTFHCSFWICNCYSCVIVSFLVILRGSIWYTVRPIYFQPFWINYGVPWLQKKISSININSRGYFLSNNICTCRESPSSSGIICL